MVESTLIYYYYSRNWNGYLSLFFKLIWTLYPILITFPGIYIAHFERSLCDYFSREKCDIILAIFVLMECFILFIKYEKVGLSNGRSWTFCSRTFLIDFFVRSTITCRMLVFRKFNVAGLAILTRLLRKSYKRNPMAFNPLILATSPCQSSVK